jgi:hypothetical protein
MAGDKELKEKKKKVDGESKKESKKDKPEKVSKGSRAQAILQLPATAINRCSAAVVRCS